MFDTNNFNLIRQLEEIEYGKAIENEALFHSVHEGYAVLLEELENIENEINSVRKNINSIWTDIKTNESPVSPLTEIALSSECLCAEAARIFAYSNKFLETAKKDMKD